MAIKNEIYITRTKGKAKITTTYSEGSEGGALRIYYTGPPLPADMIKKIVATILREHAMSPETPRRQPEALTPKQSPNLDKKVEDCRPTNALNNACRNANIIYLAELARMTGEEVAKKFGRIILRQFKGLLAREGLKHSTNIGNWVRPDQRPKPTTG